MKERGEACSENPPLVANGAVTLKPREVAASHKINTGEAETGTHRATKTPLVLRVTATKTGGEVSTRSQSDRHHKTVPQYM